MIAQIKLTRNYGLETYKVLINGVEISEFLSIAGALSYLKAKFPSVKLDSKS